MTDNRPLSPHLTIYRRQLTSVLSIMHRATGVTLSLCALLLVYWLVALASGAERYAVVQPYLGSVPVRLLILGGMFSFFFHLCNGVRHLFWDAGMGFELRRTYMTGWLVVFTSLVLTCGVFLYAVSGGGV